MKFLYLILLATATFCYDSELLNIAEVNKTKNQLFNEIKSHIKNNEIPENYKDYLDTLECSGNFIFDIIPIDNWKHESEKILLLADEGKEKTKLSECLKSSGSSTWKMWQNDDPTCDYELLNCTSTFNDYQSWILKTSKGKFVMFYYARGLTSAKPNQKSKKVKMCYKTNTLIKKCIECNIREAAIKTIQACTYSKIKEKMDAYS